MNNLSNDNEIEELRQALDQAEEVAARANDLVVILDDLYMQEILKRNTEKSRVGCKIQQGENLRLPGRKKSASLLVQGLQR